MATVHGGLSVPRWPITKHKGRVAASRERSDRIVTEAREQEKRFADSRAKVEAASSRLEAASIAIIQERDSLYGKALQAKRT